MSLILKSFFFDQRGVSVPQTVAWSFAPLLDMRRCTVCYLSLQNIVNTFIGRCTNVHLVAVLLSVTTTSSMWEEKLINPFCRWLNLHLNTDAIHLRVKLFIKCEVTHRDVSLQEVFFYQSVIVHRIKCNWVTQYSVFCAQWAVLVCLPSLASCYMACVPIK